jgi:hypothetical protein
MSQPKFEMWINSRITHTTSSRRRVVTVPGIGSADSLLGADCEGLSPVAADVSQQWGVFGWDGDR